MTLRDSLLLGAFILTHVGWGLMYGSLRVACGGWPP